MVIIIINGDNHYQWFINIFPIFLLVEVSFEILSLEFKIILYTNFDIFSYKSCSSALVMSQLSISRILCFWYICPIFSILQIFSSHFFNMASNEKYESLCLLKHFTKTVTPRTFSKSNLSHSFLSYSGFCVNIFSKSFLLFVPSLTKSH